RAGIVQVQYLDAVGAQARGGGLGAGDRAADARADRAQRIDEVIDGGAGADADDHAVGEVVERGVGAALLAVIESQCAPVMLFPARYFQALPSLMLRLCGGRNDCARISGHSQFGFRNRRRLSLAESEPVAVRHPKGLLLLGSLFLLATLLLA